MVVIEFAKEEDQEEAERLVSDYHVSEGLTPHPDRISWAVDQCLRDPSQGILLVARDGKALTGVGLGVYTPSAELGRVLTINDFYVVPEKRRTGVGRAMVQKLLEEARKTKADLVCLEILPANKTAVLFWKSVGFETAGRTIYSRDMSR